MPHNSQSYKMGVRKRCLFQRSGIPFFKLVLVLLIFFVGHTFAYRSQQIILYSEDNYKGSSKSFSTSNTDLEHDSIGKIAKSHCIVRGLWKIAGTFFNNANLTFVENAYGADRDGTGTGRICGTWHSRNRTAQYKSIEYIGSNDLDTPALSLNTMPRFLGDDLFFDGNFLRLPKPITFHSYGFTGKENWTLFHSTNFTGYSECLDASIDRQFGSYAVTFNVNKTLMVGSIWRGGCGPTSAHSRGEPENPGPPGRGGTGSQGHREESVLSQRSSVILIAIAIALLSPGSFAISTIINRA